MDIAILSLIILLSAFVLLAMFDGFYLHLIRYKLFAHPESRTEHLTHTLRAILFPIILYYLFLGDTTQMFTIGIIAVILDVLILIADAYLEKDSRAFMGGLPRWEYIIHLLVNGFHFASVAVFLVIKIRLGVSSIELSNEYMEAPYFDSFRWLAVNLIPGGVIMAIAHSVLMFKGPVLLFNRLAKKYRCC